MPRDDERLLRQLSLVSLLLSRGRPVTTREIRRSAEGYAMMTDQAFAKRFYDDRDDLREAGIVVESIPEEEGEGEAYYLPEANYHLPDLHLSPDEARALIVAFALLHDRFAYARPFRLALFSLTQGRSDLDVKVEDTATIALDQDEEAGRLGAVLARLDDACIRGKTVTFGYRTAANVRGIRTMDPYCMVRIGGHWYVVGRDHDREATRTFRLSRIDGAVRFATKKPRDFRIPPDFDPAEYRARPPWLLGPIQGTARVRVDAELAWWVARSYPSATLEGDGTEVDQVFQTPYADGRALVQWTVGLGNRAELLEPAVLRQSTVAALEAIRAAHQGPPPEARVHLPPHEPDEPGVGPGHDGPIADSAPIPPERLARVLSLLTYLLDPAKGERVSLARVKKDLGLTRTEVKDDLALLSLVNHGGGTYLLYAELEGDDILVDREPGGEPMAGPARLSPLMARALLLALDLVGDTLPAATRGPLKSAREKVEALVGGERLPGAVSVQDLVPFERGIADLLGRALAEHEVVRLEYYTPSREQLASREVEPYLLHHSGGAWYLETYCLRANDRRTFRLDLIRSATLTGTRFTPRPGEAETAREAHPSAIAPSQARWASIAFPADRLHLLLDQGLEVWLEDDAVRARIPYLDERWLVREVMRYLGEAVLLEPRELRAHVAAAAETLRERYTAPAR